MTTEVEIDKYWAAVAAHGKSHKGATVQQSREFVDSHNLELKLTAAVTDQVIYPQNPMLARYHTKLFSLAAANPKMRLTDVRKKILHEHPALMDAALSHSPRAQIVAAVAVYEADGKSYDDAVAHACADFPGAKHYLVEETVEPTPKKTNPLRTAGNPARGKPGNAPLPKPAPKPLKATNDGERPISLITQKPSQFRRVEK